ncbi:MAG: S8 family serine peptidase [Kofleriaceae bacterium]|nr:S8 family serine peptidase [Kofleriaceae bacterium]
MRTTRSIVVFCCSLVALSAIALTLWSPDTQTDSVVHRPAVHFKLLPSANVMALNLDASMTVAPLFNRGRAALAADRNEALALGAVETPDLSAWYRATNPSDPAALVKTLLRRDDVEVAFIAPRPELALLMEELDEGKAAQADDRCPITTPTYHPLQGYLVEAPGGIDAPAAWALPGGLGGNVAFADIEGGWNARHEDLPTERIEHVAGEQYSDRNWVAHGTAVVGVVAAKDNDLGMVGIAPDVAKIVTASLSPQGPASAIDEAQAVLERGDVLLIELHSVGPRGRYLPMEFWDDVFDAVKVATDRGVIVVAAAGNGGENLDHKTYRRKFDRRFRDSGAILVGAGAPNRKGFVDRSRLDFSNYGGRVDVQGWGYKVASLDYGDLQDCGSPHRRKYTAEFSGTSSASPIVAGAALLLQSIYKERSDRMLSPREMRSLLTRTGSPQTDGPYGRAATQQIGTRPDLRRALAELPD